jgi:hypothetical protein
MSTYGNKPPACLWAKFGALVSVVSDSPAWQVSWSALVRRPNDAGLLAANHSATLHMPHVGVPRGILLLAMSTYGNKHIAQPAKTWDAGK